MLAEQGIDPSQQEAEKKTALLLGDVAKEDKDLQIIIRTARVLIDIGEPLQASVMLADCISTLTRRCVDQ